MNEHGLELGNAALVQRLYGALAAHDPASAQQLLAPELDVWYYGPPDLHFLKRILTGLDPSSAFSFHPFTIFVKHNKVFAEGLCSSSTTKDPRPHTWVHIWNVKDGRLVRLREYVDASVNVMDSNDSSSNAPPPRNHHVVVDQDHHHQHHDHPILWSSTLGGKHVQHGASAGPSLIIYSP